MNSIDPAHCRENLQKLVADEIAALTTLESLLAREHELLVANDVDNLERAGAARQECVGVLVRIENERRGLCRMLGQDSDTKGLANLMDWCDPGRTLASSWSECATRAKRCRELNDRNGILVGARLQRVSNMLGMLNAGGRDSQVYGPQGTSPSGTATPGRMVAARA
ncbi:MAG: flagellar protein FlgN [Steroidobacteraceae bacterium]